MCLAFSSQKQVRCDAGQSQGSWRVICTWHQSDQVYLILAKTLNTNSAVDSTRTNWGYTRINTWTTIPGTYIIPAILWYIYDFDLFPPNFDLCVFTRTRNDTYFITSFLTSTMVYTLYRLCYGTYTTSIYFRRPFDLCVITSTRYDTYFITSFLTSTRGFTVLLQIAHTHTKARILSLYNIHLVCIHRRYSLTRVTFRLWIANPKRDYTDKLLYHHALN